MREMSEAVPTAHWPNQRTEQTETGRALLDVSKRENNMFDKPFAPTTLHEFLQEHHEPLQNAALLLGGRPWLRRMQRILDDFAMKSIASHRTRDELVKLHGLLTLEYIHDFDTPEAVYFADLDPHDSIVEEICLLADELSAALVSVGIDMPDPLDFADDEAIWGYA